ncbi:hypothetical protein [Clostridium sp. OS1-26]|uniref:hypothetical protein n=1 Tax=Clostridium sp. OS1-26 TaxID=3070681 RepID=UPI0027E0FA60|nr:hypothetical protein [Clostridium sp. OS1-26]WML36784.1 hypothetical protein RCG18_09235 [Clostridium sp. OS1-26]
MRKTGNKKAKKLLLIVIVGIIIACGVFFKLLTWNSEYTAPSAKLSHEFISNVVKSQSTGILELNNEDLNSIIKIYIDKKNYGNLNIKAVHGEIADKELNFYIPSSYKGVEFLFSSKGTMTFEGNKVKYNPEKFYVGKVPLPRGYVLSRISGLFHGGISIENNSVCLDASLIPLKVNNVYLKDSKIVLEVKKFNDTYNSKLKFLEELLKYIH